MHRRDFLRTSATAALTLPLADWARLAPAQPLGVVVHSYASRWQSKLESRAYPGFAHALDLLEHCHELGAAGVQVGVSGWSADFARQVRDRRERLGLYLEGSIGLPLKPEEVPRFEAEVRQAREAGARIIRTVCLGGRRYEVFPSAEAFETFSRTSRQALRAAVPILAKHGVKLAVENHKDWRAAELAELLRELGSEWVGVTLDFGNNLALLEDPRYVVDTLAPYTISTHIKDMGLTEYPDGFLLAEVPLGTGVLDLPALVATCRKHRPDVTFNLEMITRDPLKIPCLTEAYWATFGTVPGADLARTLRLVRERRAAALPAISTLTPEARLAAEEQNVRACLDYGRRALARS
jgi:sugar phosphate isomerase/epimerase